MNRRYLSFAFAPVLACLAVPMSALAQSTLSIFDGATTPAVQTPSPANSVPLSEIEHYSNYNGRLSLTIPLHHIGGRGEAGYDILAVINTVWDIQKHLHPDGSIDYIEPLVSVGPSLKLEPVIVDGYDSFSFGAGGSCPAGVQDILQTEVRFQAHWSDGADVSLRDTGLDGAPARNPYECQGQAPADYDAGRHQSAKSRDGSELLLQLDTPIKDPVVTNGSHQFAVSGNLYTANGTQYRLDRSALSWIKDRNGNETTFVRDPSDFRFVQSVTDSTGVMTTYARSITSATCGMPQTCDQIQYPGVGSQMRAISVHYASLSSVLRSDFAPQNIGQLLPSASYLLDKNASLEAPAFISSITYPDGFSYTFLYDPYGEIAQITLPTGGSIKYDYASGDSTPEGFEGNESDAYPLFLYRRLKTRRVYDVNGSFMGSTEYIWGNETGGFKSTETVKDSAGNVLSTTTTHYSSDPTGERTLDPFAYPPYTWGRATKVEEGDPVKKTTDYHWAQNPVSWCSGSGVCNAGDPENDPQITDIKTTLNDTQQVSDVVLGYDQYNNVIDRTEYDFGNGTRGGVIRHTHTDYVTNYVTDPNRSNTPVNLLRLPKQVNIYGNTDADLEALTYYYYDESSLDDAPNIPSSQHDPLPGDNLRGNLTTKMSWQRNPNSYITEKYTYDITGNVTRYIDGRANVGATPSPTVRYAYNDANNTYAHPTTITNALLQSVGNTYDYYTGKLIQATDLNGVNTVYSYADDPLDRLKQIRRAAGSPTLESQTNFTYPSENEVDTFQDKVSTGDEAIKTRAIFDGFGRLATKVTVEDGSHTIETTTNYDVLGRVSSTFNPTQVTGGSNDGLGYATQYTYDSLGRVTKVVAQDTSPTTTDYTGSTATITDATGRQRKLTYDALGRLKNVAEDPNGVNYTTIYNYDPLDDLISVDQGSQHRSFTYDGLRRLKSATNPESGTLSYTYDEDGNLKTKQDARNITITYTYDPLNRIQSKQYSDGVTPAAGWVYDSKTIAYGIGRLSSVSDGYSVTNFLNYNALGQLTQSNQQTLNQTYPFSYSWNLAGSLTSETYPSGRVVTTSYDEANRVSGVQGAVGSVTVNYVSNVAYWPHGVPYYYILGNHIERVFTYNKQLQAACWWDAVNNSPESVLFQECPSWGTGNNNGNLQSVTANEGGPGEVGTLAAFSATYTYDGVNRLLTASDNGGAWSRTYGHDQFGNMWVSADTGIPLGSQTPTTNIYAGGNQMGGQAYDAVGNQTTIGTYTLAHDAENRMIQATDAPSAGGGWVKYYYDANGQRAVKEFSDGGATVYVYDAFGKLAAAYNNFAAITPPCGTCYLTTDYLGSVRMVTDPNANVVTRHDYLPFGQEILAGQAGRGSQWGASSPVNEKFTGKERDKETNLDYFGARYYSGALGRFTSPDWSEQPDTVPYAEFENPQTLNLYSYARNNPLTYNDPDGHDVNVCLNDENGNQHCTQMTNEQYAAASQGNAGTNVPTLDQVGMNGNGSGSFNATNITDSNGNSIGTATYVSNGGADYYANRNGINFLSYQTAPVVNGLAYATGGVMAGAGIGAGYGAFAGGSALITLGSIPAGLQPGAVVGGFVLTEHAVEQAAERGVTLQDIEEAVEGVAKGNPNPARAWDSVVRFYGANCEVRVNRITGTIVTVIKKSNK